jgi:hypothetical protein
MGFFRLMRKRPGEKAALQRRIEMTDRLVYGLYELTPEEIAVVKGATATDENG